MTQMAEDVGPKIGLYVVERYGVKHPPSPTPLRFINETNMFDDFITSNLGWDQRYVINMVRRMFDLKAILLKNIFNLTFALEKFPDETFKNIKKIITNAQFESLIYIYTHGLYNTIKPIYDTKENIANIGDIVLKVLLTFQFFSTMIDGDLMKISDTHKLNFDLFEQKIDGKDDGRTEKLKGVLNYLQTDVKYGSVSMYMAAGDKSIQSSAWKASKILLSSVVIDVNTDSRIDNVRTKYREKLTGQILVEVYFGEEYFGGKDLLSNGISNEDVRFCVSPQLISLRNFLYYKLHKGQIVAVEDVSFVSKFDKNLKYTGEETDGIKSDILWVSCRMLIDFRSTEIKTKV